MGKVFNVMLSAFLLNAILLITHETKSIDTQVIPYYNRFMDIADKCMSRVNNETVRIEMTDNINPSYVAVCFYATNIVQINRKVWNRLSNEKREQTIFHELGHCLLNQSHDDDDLNLMNTYGFVNKQLYVYNYDYFVRKLFKDCSAPLYEKFQYEETI